MKQNLKDQYEAFLKLSFEEKQNIVISLLEDSREGDELLESIYNLITSDFVIEQDLNDVFNSLVAVLYKEEKSKEQEALLELNEIRNRLQAQKAKELEEQFQGKKEAEELLLSMV